MIVLTGDIHHMTLRSPDQVRLPHQSTETSVCEQYLEIANEADIEPTIYASGRLANEERQLLSRLCQTFRFELGGHTYACMKPRLLYVFSRKVLRRANGPRFYQSVEITRTLNALGAAAGVPIRSWRNHAYSQDCNTARLLCGHGLQSVSNQVAIGTGAVPIDTPSGRIWSFPINTPPDHENLHPEYGNAGGWSFRNAYQWAAAVLRQIERNEQASIPSVILAHPACMAVEDGMAGLRWLFGRLPKRKCLTMARLVESVSTPPSQ